MISVKDLHKMVKGKPSVEKQVSNPPGVLEKFALLMRGNKPETKSVYLCHINRFLRFLNKREMDEWSVRKFLSYLEEKEFSRNSQRCAWFALKKYFKANKIEWTLDKSEYPKLDKTKVCKPTLSKENVLRMVDMAKKMKWVCIRGKAEEKLSPQCETVMLALSSTYGLRRAEICSIFERDIDRKEHTLHIQTLKGGEERYHLIPEAIRERIYHWDFNTVIPVSTASILFHSICAEAGIQRVDQMGWHSIRRSLTTELLSAGVPGMRVYNFTRWKDRSMGMLSEYDNPDFKDVDELIFEKHPFIGAWRE